MWRDDQDREDISKSWLIGWHGIIYLGSTILFATHIGHSWRGSEDIGVSKILSKMHTTTQAENSWNLRMDHRTWDKSPFKLWQTDAWDSFVDDMSSFQRFDRHC